MGVPGLIAGRGGRRGRDQHQVSALEPSHPRIRQGARLPGLVDLHPEFTRVGLEHGGRVSDVERRIVNLLEDSVRPAVQRDGGDIAFAGYDDGTVQLYMLGSCVGCPSAMATLKMGVENLLKDSIPEVKEVIAID